MHVHRLSKSRYIGYHIGTVYIILIEVKTSRPNEVFNILTLVWFNTPSVQLLTVMYSNVVVVTVLNDNDNDKKLF